MISQEIPPCPTTTAARSTVTGTPPRAEQLLDVAAGAQVRREIVVQIPEATEVDDLLDAGVGCRVAELGRGLGVALFEVVGIQRMHQVVGGVHALQGRTQAVRFGDIAVRRLAAAVVGIRVTGHRLDPMALFEQGGNQLRSDEAGGAGDEHRSCHDVSTALRGRSDAVRRHGVPHSRAVRDGVSNVVIT